MRIKTRSGHLLDLDSPEPDQIDVGDIITGMSNRAIYNGQTRYFMSYAEHATNVSDLLLPSGRILALHGLFYEAPAAYLPPDASGSFPADRYERLRLVIAKALHLPSLRAEQFAMVDKANHAIWNESKISFLESKARPAMPMPPLAADMAMRGRWLTLTAEDPIPGRLPPPGAVPEASGELKNRPLGRNRLLEAIDAHPDAPDAPPEPRPARRRLEE